MNAAITKRILWKEYRTQRGLWGALLLCIFLFQLLALSLAENKETATQIAHVTGALLTLCYAAGCGAISFAADREEGTQLRLQTLVCPPIWTVTLKLGFIILTTLVLVAVFLTTAWLMTGHTILSVLQEESISKELLGLCWVTFVYGAILMWTMFFSLLTRSVLSAIGLGAAGACLFVWSTMVAAHGILPRRFNPVNIEVPEVLTLFGLSAVCLLAVFCCNCVLSGRWFRHYQGEAPKVKRFALLRRFRIRASSGGGSFVLKVDTEVSHADEVLSANEAATQPCPRAGLSWLYLAWGSLTWRTLRFLRWRESHESRWRFILLFAACVLITQSCAGQLQRAIYIGDQFPGQRSDHSLVAQSSAPFLALVLFAFATACGVMSFRQEHAGEQFRVLRDRGVPAWLLWLSKHCVWGSRAFLGTAVQLIVVGLATSDFARGTSWLISCAFGYHSDFDPVGELPVPILIWWAILVTSLFYAAGQVASLVCKRSIIAFFVGVLFMTFLIIAAALSQRFGIPLGWSLLPLVPAALVLTLLRCRCWMVDQTGPRSWLPSSIVVAVACLLCVVQSSLHRMWEYPDVDPQAVYAEAYPLQLGEQTFESLEAEVAPFLARQNPSEAAQKTAEIYGKASDLLRPIGVELKSDFVEEFSQPVAFADFTDGQRRWLAEEAAALESTLQAADRDECSFWTGESLNRQRFPEFIREQAALVIASALELESEGKVEEALDRFQLALNISRHLGGDGGAFSFVESRKIAISVYAQLRLWAGNRLVTPELAERAVAMIRSHQQSLGSLTVMNVVEHRALRSWLANFDAYSAKALSAEDSLIFGMLRSLPGEKTREQRILNMLEARHAKEFFEHRQLLHGGSRAGQSAATHNEAGMALPVDPDLLARVFRTTPLLGQIYPLMTAPRDAAVECEQAARATELAIRMLSTSRENETPLDPEEHPARCRVDVWSGQELTWYPNGIRSDAHAGGVVIPAGRPFLWSSGTAPAELIEASHQEPHPFLRARPATEKERQLGMILDGPIRERGTRTIYSYTVHGQVGGETVAPHVYLLPKTTPMTEPEPSITPEESPRPETK
jgi:hypothetical protein